MFSKEDIFRFSNTRVKFKSFLIYSVKRCLQDSSQDFFGLTFNGNTGCVYNNIKQKQLLKTFMTLSDGGGQWLSGRVLDSRPRGCGFEPHWRHYVVVLEQDTFILA